ncbi:MAG: hypothetical protein NT009_00395 [Proteobacteria bacterium]|nr:hypothetical protein [Pseudomonadota bacterium]
MLIYTSLSTVIPAKAGIQILFVIPAKAGIQILFVIPAKAGIQILFVIPAKAGIQEWKLDSPGSSPGQA